jgi:DNA-directed RNA polymerase specialized sigma24 family protein
MFEDESFDETLERLRASDEAAATAVFRRYLARLIALAGKQFDAKMRERVDVEEAVLSAFRTFFARARRGEFDLSGWGDLWSLLAVITLRKCSRRRRALSTARRNLSREAGAVGEKLKTQRVVDPAPSPVEAAMLSETVEELLGEFDAHDRPIVEHILQGYTAEETAGRLDCSERTVRRVRGRAKHCLERLIRPETGKR